MSNVIRYSSEDMRAWADNILKSNDDYFSNVKNLFDEVESFIGTGYTGNLAEEFLASFQDKKKYFIDNNTVIEECGKIITSRAENIDFSDQELMNKIKRENYFN